MACFLWFALVIFGAKACQHASKLVDKSFTGERSYELAAFVAYVGLWAWASVLWFYEAFGSWLAKVA